MAPHTRPVATSIRRRAALMGLCACSTVAVLGVFVLSGGAPREGARADAVPGVGKPRTEASASLPSASPEYAVLPDADDVFHWALEDLLTLPPYSRQYVRYLAIPDGELESAQTCSLVLNLVSRA